MLNRGDNPEPLTPVRKIPRSHRSVTGYFSFRREAQIQFESTLERDFLVRQEFDLVVADVISQPCRIPYRTDSGRSSHYTPDFLVRYRTNTSPLDWQRPSLLVEVKPAEAWKANWRSWSSKWKAARGYAIENGWIFRIYDESRIRTQALANIQFLQRYRHLDFAAADGDWVLQTLSELGAASVDYLVARHFQGLYRAEGLALLWHLLAIRRLECDICAPLCGQTELWVPHDS